MRINSISYNYRAQAQNFKGIKILNPQDKEAVDKMLDGKKAIFDAATEAKDIDIFLFGQITKEGGEKIPSYAGIIQQKSDRRSADGRQKAVATFKCPMTEDGLKDAQGKIERAVIWANAPVNLPACAAIDGLGKNDEQKQYIEDLKSKMIKAKCDNESIVWKEKLDMLITRDENNIDI